VSLILDALNRSRQDDGQIPSLATQHYEDVVEGHRNRYQLLLVLALLLALSAIGWLLWDREAETEPVVAAAAPANPAAPSPQLPTAAPAAAPSRAIVPVQATTRIEPAPVREMPPAVHPMPVGEDGKPLAGGPQPVSTDPGVAELYRQQSPAQPAAETAAEPVASAGETPEQVQTESAAAATPVREEQPIDIEALVGQAREELADAKLDQHEVPFIVKLSQQTKNGIPTILYQRHDYSGTAAKSTVVLNGKKLKVGGKAAAGVTVIEILPDSVVLNHKGTRFRLRALNSWVNL
jgi:general secretion pathway protein B